MECNWDIKALYAAQIFAQTMEERKLSFHDIAILTPHKQSDAGTVAINLNVRLALGMPGNRLVKGDLLIVIANNYKAPRQDGDGFEKIHNGERAIVANIGDDFLDLDFPPNTQGHIRQIRLLMRNPDAGTIEGQLPEDFALGYALSTHKAQGSQFQVVIAITAQAYRTGGIVQRSNVYTAISRAQKLLIVVGDVDEFIGAAAMDEIPRRTLLEKCFEARGLSLPADRPRRPGSQRGDGVPSSSGALVSPSVGRRAKGPAPDFLAPTLRDAGTSSPRRVSAQDRDPLAPDLGSASTLPRRRRARNSRSSSKP